MLVLLGPNAIIESSWTRNSHHIIALLGLKDALQCQDHRWLSKVIFFPFQNARIRLNACCVGESICQYIVEYSQMLKTMTRLGLRLYGHLIIDSSVITKNTSNDMFAQRFRTKYSLLIFGVHETLYYLNVAFKNEMPYFRRPIVNPTLH